MDLSGEFLLAGVPQRVFPLLTEPSFFCKHLPDTQGSQILDANNFMVKVKVGVGFMRDIFEFKLRFADKTANNHARVLGTGVGRGSSVDLDIDFSLTETDGKTRVAWKSNVKMSGVIASIAGGAIKPIINKNLTTFVESLRKGIETSLSQPSAT